jgi:dephospho-CoA kinase
MLVAITGNLGSGKSTLRRAFERLGYNTYDSDQIVSEIYKKPEIIKLIGEEFGQDVIVNKKVDRGILAKKVFNSSIKLKRLNQIIHPIVIQKISEINHEGDLCFVEVPLLFEAKMERLFDKIILTHAPHEVCKQRALKSGFAEEEFEKRVAFQYAFDRVSRSAHFVVDTDTNISEINVQAMKIASELAQNLKSWKGF